MKQQLQLKSDLSLNHYDYLLDNSLIAIRPTDVRSNCKLMAYHKSSDSLSHFYFYDLVNLLEKDTTLVLNESKVIPARLLGKKESGGKAELLLLDIKKSPYPVLIKCRGKKQINQKFIFKNFSATITDIKDNQFFVVFDKNITEVLKYGMIPIPPYIRKGKADLEDESNYQTVYAKNLGSIASPTAGLHFDKNLLTNLKNAKIDIAYVTLHVGVGTFNPITSLDITKHSMHYENFLITKENYLKIKNSKNLVPVGTTSLRVIESIDSNFIPDTLLSTNKYIYPGYKFKENIKGLITNFHLPKSTLLLLVAALIGREKMMDLYKIAIEKKYRFYSYGDAMYLNIK